MSAYIVDRRHIDYLLTAGFRLAYPPYGPMRWQSPDETPADVHQAGSPWGPGYLAHIHKVQRTLEAGTADMVGAMLWEQNYRSVNFRYDEEGWKNAVPDYTYSEFYGKIDPVQVLKAISCYRYQSCESPDWDETEAAAFCDALESYAIKALPGYDAASWGAPEAVAYGGKVVS